MGTGVRAGTVRVERHPMAASAALPIEGGPGTEEAFQSRLGELESLHVGLWRATDTRPPMLDEPVTRERQRENASEAERLLDDLARCCEAYPDSEAARRSWRADVRERVRRFGEERLGWPDGYRSLLLSEAFYGSTAEFVRAARAFDPRVRMEDVVQALRNVWIMNSLQLLLDAQIVFSPAIFAYSMLYPCTDNFLDDPGVSRWAKADFNRRLGRRLRGERLVPGTGHEWQAFALVDRIEGQYSRDHAPDVFRSLLAIHRAQQASLVQQRTADPPGADRVREISVAKGGASLLADGYLVQGDLSAEEQELCFGYGVFLQLLDDLQDVRDDREAGHTTLFTIAAREGTLDQSTGRLYEFMTRVLGRSPCIAGPAYAERRDLVFRNCTFLLVGSIARHRRLFSRPFLRAVEKRWPFDLASMSRLQRTAARRFRRVRRELARRSGARSLLELL
jgi:hypothetical protein